MFLARGNNEPYPGRQGVLVDAICSGLSSCGYEDIMYDATLDSAYGPTVYQGAVNGIAQVTAYAEDCPDSQLVLSGYSEGAHVVGDILGGGGGDWWDTAEPLVTGLDSAARSPGNKSVFRSILSFRLPLFSRGNPPRKSGKNTDTSTVAAALMFGDVRHTASQSYNVESGARDQGVFPRNATELANLGRFSSVLRAYCVATDPVCAGGDDVSTHLSYFDIYTDDAASWVKSMLGVSGSATAGVSSTIAFESSVTAVPTSSLAGASTASTTASNSMSSAEPFSVSVVATSTQASSGTSVGAATATSASSTDTSGSTTLETQRVLAGLAFVGACAFVAVQT